jgi:hypothetical protein
MQGQLAFTVVFVIPQMYVVVQAMMLGFPSTATADYASSTSSTDVGDLTGYCSLPGNRHPLMPASNEPTPPLYTGKQLLGRRTALVA